MNPIRIGPFRFCGKGNGVGCPMREQEYKEGIRQYKGPFTLCRQFRSVEKGRVFADISGDEIFTLSGKDKKLKYKRISVFIFILSVIHLFAATPAYENDFWSSGNSTFHIIHSLSFGLAVYFWIRYKLLTVRSRVVFNRKTKMVHFPKVDRFDEMQVGFSEIDFFISYAFIASRGGGTRASSILAKPRGVKYYPDIELLFDHHIVINFYDGVMGNIDVLYLLCCFMRGNDINSEVELMSPYEADKLFG